MDIAKYIVTDRKTGRELAQGTAQECADTLGITYNSFLATASRSKQGRTKYQIERTNAKTKALPLYPCKGCVYAARCDRGNLACNAWRRWFTANYDHAARQLRAAARKEAQCRNND